MIRRNLRRMLAAAGLLILVGWVARLVVDARVFETLEPRSSFGACTRITSIQGAEDLHPLDDRHLLVSANFHAPRFTDPALRGELILLVAEEAKDVRVVRLDTSMLGAFRPHGIAVDPDGPGRFKVAAVNHSPEGDRIELFALDLGTHALSHLRSVRDPVLLANANDVVFLSPDELLVTHDHGTKNHTTKLLERFLRPGLGYVTYWNKEGGRKVLSGLNFANGIDSLGDGSWIIASMLDKKLHKVSWESRGQTLKVDLTVTLPGFPDNVRYDASRQKLWVALHEKIFELKGFSEGKRDSSPSRVVTLDSGLSGLETVFASSQPDHAAISTAQPWGNQVALGNIYSDHLELCDATLETVTR